MRSLHSSAFYGLMTISVHAWTTSATWLRRRLQSDPIKQVVELAFAQLDALAVRKQTVRHTKHVTIEPFVEKTKPSPIEEQDLQRALALSEEYEERAAASCTSDLLFNQASQAIESPPQVDRSKAHKELDAARNHDRAPHSAAANACNTIDKQRGLCRRQLPRGLVRPGQRSVCLERVSHRRPFFERLAPTAPASSDPRHHPYASAGSTTSTAASPSSLSVRRTDAQSGRSRATPQPHSTNLSPSTCHSACAASSGTATRAGEAHTIGVQPARYGPQTSYTRVASAMLTAPIVQPRGPRRSVSACWARSV